MPPDEDPDDIELPLDEESVGEMMRIAGTENIYATKHVVVVYTSTKQKAAEIATRLEAIWRWRVRFMKMLNLPLRMPEHKLELYYFADHEEFKTLQVNIGGQPDDGTLGFFSPDSNRSHFFGHAHLAADQDAAPEPQECSRVGKGARGEHGAAMG